MPPDEILLVRRDELLQWMHQHSRLLEILGTVLSFSQEELACLQPLLEMLQMSLPTDPAVMQALCVVSSLQRDVLLLVEEWGGLDDV